MTIGKSWNLVLQLVSEFVINLSRHHTAEDHDAFGIKKPIESFLPSLLVVLCLSDEQHRQIGHIYDDCLKKLFPINILYSLNQESMSL